MIDSRVMEVNKGSIEIPFSNFTKDYKKDIYILTYLLGELLPDNVPFDISKFKIIQYNEDTIVVSSNKKEWVIRINNLYSYDEKMAVDYTFYIIRE